MGLHNVVLAGRYKVTTCSDEMSKFACISSPGDPWILHYWLQLKKTDFPFLKVWMDLYNSSPCIHLYMGYIHGL